MTRDAAARMVATVPKAAGITKRIGPHSLRHSFITAALDAGVPFGTSKRPHRTPIRGRRCATTAPASPSTGTLPTSSPPSSPAPLEVKRHTTGRASAAPGGRPGAPQSQLGRAAPGHGFSPVPWIPGIIRASAHVTRHRVLHGRNGKRDKDAGQQQQRQASQHVRYSHRAIPASAPRPICAATS